VPADTGKRKLDVALEAGQEWLEVDNTAAGHQALAAWLQRHRVERVGIEASGGYEQDVVAELRRKGFVGWCSSPPRFGPTPGSICNAPKTTRSTPP
jgi:transposase